MYKIILNLTFKLTENTACLYYRQHAVNYRVAYEMSYH